MRFLLLFIFLSMSLSATHIIGGNFKIQQTGKNSYQLDLTIFRDCGKGDPNDPSDDPVDLQQSITVRIFDQFDNSLLQSISVSRGGPTNIQLGDKCYTPTNLCVEEYHFTRNFSLADNQYGYIVAAQSCCRNFNVSNISSPGTTGVTWSAYVPDPALSGQNSSPDLGPYPQLGFLCVHSLRTIDLSATDEDGDSLAYELVTPYNGPRATPGNPDPYTPPPFNTITWLPGFSKSNAIPGAPALSLDPETGILSCNASQLGLYAFAYRVSEYRNGIKIGEIQRDLQLEVLSCQQQFDPIIFEPSEDEFVIATDGQLCFSVSVIDSNITDTILLSSTLSEAFNGLSVPPNSLSRRGIGSTGGTICWVPGCEGTLLSNEELKITLTARSIGCEGERIVKKEITITLEAPPDALSTSLPNIFTPNGDDVNDNFSVAQSLGSNHPCMQNVLIKIYNRWGNLIFESTESNMDWDGTYQGKMVSQGVYFYTVEGLFGNQPFEYRDFLTLKR